MECMNSEINLNRWFFHLGETKRFGKIDHNAYYLACKAGGAMGNIEIFKSENEWASVHVPHDWLTYIAPDENEAPAGGYKKRGSAWYYTSVSLDTFESATLVFDGVLGVCEVYVNGTLAIRNFSGYNRFSCDVSSYLTSGENIIAVHVNAEVWEGWWYEGAGIYRSVKLVLKPSLHFSTDDIFVRGIEINGAWYIAADFETSGNGRIISTLTDAEGTLIDTFVGCHVMKSVECPKLWSPKKPYLYTFEAKLYDGETLCDTFRCEVGFRKIEWRSEHGMFLNGEKTRIKGICCHQDHAGVGAATSKTLTEYRLKKLKALGINAYRCAHHAPSEELLSTCDRLGILVMVENRHFNISPDTMAQIDALVKLSRNHPCVFLYSLFNEELWQSEERGLKIAKKLRERILLLDTTRAVTAAMNGGVLERRNASEVLDVIGINYFIEDYESCHKKAPDKAIIGTENCPTFATRGVYREDSEKQVWSSYADKWADTFSESLDRTMKAYFDHSFNAGCFVWSGFDYRGEPQPYEWPSVTSHWGIMDLCGFEKDTAYHLAGYYKDELFVHLLPHWNHKEHDKVRICAFTNALGVDLYQNGRHMGYAKAVNCRAEWIIGYDEGSIEVIVHDGQKEARDKRWTAGDFGKIQFDVTEGEEMRIIDLTATDVKGHPIPDFCDEFEVVEGTVLGIGNGNPNSHHLDTSRKLEFFNSRAQVIVQGKTKIRCRNFEAEV